jgi:putative membrane protein
VSLTALTANAATVAAHWGGPWGVGFPWFVIFIPLFWILVFALIFGLFGRRWRRAAAMGYGPYGSRGPRSAEATLAERFAQGDIDEVEYRARLEVLRANRPTP